MKESQLLSSSFFKTSQDSLGHSPHRARLGSSGHWSPADGSASIDRICTHILAFEADGKFDWFEGNFDQYEQDKIKRLGENYMNNSSKYKKFTR